MRGSVTPVIFISPSVPGPVGFDGQFRNSGDSPRMGQRTYELQGYTLVLDKVQFITRVFAAENDAGFQFNVRFGSDLRLSPQFPSRHEAELERSLLVKALKAE